MFSEVAKHLDTVDVSVLPFLSLGRFGMQDAGSLVRMTSWQGLRERCEVFRLLSRGPGLTAVIQSSPWSPSPSCSVSSCELNTPAVQKSSVQLDTQSLDSIVMSSRKTDPSISLPCGTCNHVQRKQMLFATMDLNQDNPKATMHQ